MERNAGQRQHRFDGVASVGPRAAGRSPAGAQASLSGPSAIPVTVPGRVAA